jgi:hypothetical protein
MESLGENYPLLFGRHFKLKVYNGDVEGVLVEGVLEGSGGAAERAFRTKSFSSRLKNGSVI